MKLDGISAFVAIAEAGSISEAARRLRLSKSVVSDRLAQLERRLGASLVHRSTRKLSLTEDGLAFLELASESLRRLDTAVAALAERRGTLAGPLRISAPVSLTNLHIGPALYPFLLRHPEIELTLELDDRRIDAQAEGFDGVVRHGPMHDSRLMAWRLARSRRVLVASQDYLERHGTPRTLNELDGHRGIFYTHRGIGDWRFVTAQKVVQVRGKVALRVNNGMVMRDAASAGLGITLLPLFLAGPDIRAGTLRVVEVGAAPEPEFIYVAHPEGRHPSAKLRALADCLRAAFGDPPYWEAGL
ncbi:LysR family transcriptional regulator [Ancylobacter pratisalsi]|uniref:LysR family transcriptional regulator n=1 Tax=Ancylobacter pratisalsi TaxID=1745854 RepID=A0A6P1YL94_9HYPH|nr:LysR family transcriptional regulator [Ancylobacter pratisalsi]QIB33852.1 LysR family transcriptional regulator [Ancylobacter pratisalsi]